MGAAAVAAPAVLSGFSAIAGGIGGNQQAQYAAGVDKIHAMEARTAADQTDAGLRDELRGVLGDISVTRAAAGMSNDSPTIQAIIANEQRTSDKQRTIQRQNYMNQANAYDMDAKMQRSAGRAALFGGAIKGLSSFASAYNSF